MTTKAELLKVIKLECQNCMGSPVARKGELDGEAGNLVKICTASDCNLYPYRMGRDPAPSKKRVAMGKKLGFPSATGSKKSVKNGR